MVKNLKRYKKLLEKEGRNEEIAQFLYYIRMNYYPNTFNLPAEYTIFLEEFKKN
jgi:tubulin polyglutamylase TTLL9